MNIRSNGEKEMVKLKQLNLRKNNYIDIGTEEKLLFRIL